MTLDLGLPALSTEPSFYARARTSTSRDLRRFNSTSQVAPILSCVSVDLPTGTKLVVRIVQAPVSDSLTSHCSHSLSLEGTSTLLERVVSIMRAISVNLLCLAAACLPLFGAGFVVPASLAGRGTTCIRRSMMSSADDSSSELSRRGTIGRVLSSGVAIFVSGVALAEPASAKKSPPEPITAETVTSAFDAIRYELEDPAGGIATLERRISAKDFEGVMDFTKNYDGFFRKARVGRARKLLTDKKLKDDAVLMSNAITFDLIGINRASRPGQENQEEANKYLGELKADIQKILDLESTVDLSAVEGS